MRALAAIFILTAMIATPASAADWSKAGGSLFVGQKPRVSRQDAGLREPTDGEDVRVSAPVEPYAAAIEAAARAHGLDPKLLHALVIVESAYHARARSRVGAQGLSQLMPATASRAGVADAFDPQQNLEGGARYLAAQIVRFGDLRLALAAYNAGPGRVARTGRVPDYPQTQAYVAAVVDCYLALTAGRSPRGASGCRGASPIF